LHTFQGHDAGYAIYLSSSDMLIVDMGSFPDGESGVQSTSVHLYTSATACGLPSQNDTLLRSMIVDNETQVKNWKVVVASVFYFLGC
jgi:hypothetical protein